MKESALISLQNILECRTAVPLQQCLFTIWQRLYWSWRLSGASVPTPGNPLYFIRLLVLEDYFPEMKLERNLQTGDVVINFHNKKLNEFLFMWGVIRGKRAKGLISEEEYREWKYKLQK